eukprot:TRINITY_DN2956_c0_g1_i1.p1 TRINITY_DN2956_c0_g1~~TRINITY_DN2956_c0_g1_i1.p1  ORF type:complete len:288 (+),score=80.62 TRINITY_DN2956_c0_g1_i1:132-866(+)
MKTWAILLLLISASIFAFAQDQAASEAEPEEQVVDEETILAASPDVVTTVLFPDFPNTVFPLGKEINVLIGVENVGEESFNVTSISAALRYPTDWRYFIQNYTRVAQFVTVQPGDQTTFLYRFMPDAMLEAREFGLSGQLFYSDLHGNNFTSYFFNQTISLIESSDSIDAQTLFTYVGVIGVAGLILFVVYKSVGAEKKTKRAPKVETGTQGSTVVDDEWLEGTHAKPKSPKSGRSPTAVKKNK